MAFCERPILGISIKKNTLIPNKKYLVDIWGKIRSISKLRYSVHIQHITQVYNLIDNMKGAFGNSSKTFIEGKSVFI
jgi:hypothetical protein